VSPQRTFLDEFSRLWNAWDVIPLWGERRNAERRRQSGAASAALVDRRTSERRRTPGIRIALPARLARGWVAFECDDERRRVAPIPAGWDTLPDEGLRELWRGAERLPPRRKGLVE
jgi:hypothetical protein